MSRVEGCCDEARVDGSGNELFESPRCRQLERRHKVFVGERGVGVREGQQGKKQELLVLLC